MLTRCSLEATDLWKEALKARGKSVGRAPAPQNGKKVARPQASEPSEQSASKSRKIDPCSTLSNGNGQGVLLVAEPHSELNAGFIVIFASSHPPVLDVDEWEAELATVRKDQKQNIIKAKSVELVDQYWSKCESAISKPRWTTPENTFPRPNHAEPRCFPLAPR